MRLLDDGRYLSEMIGRIYDCALRPERWEHVVLELQELIGGCRSMLSVVSPGGRLLLGHVLHGVGPNDPMEQYSPINPLIPYGLTWPFDKAFRASCDCGFGNFRVTRYYKEYLAPRNLHDAVIFVVTRDGGAFGHWGIVTDDKRGVITDQEAAGLELIAPHFRRAIEISTVLGAQRVATDTYRAALDQLGAAVLIVDEGRQIFFANPAAEVMLEKGQPLRRSGLRLRGSTDPSDLILSKAIAAKGGFEALMPGGGGAEWLLFAISLDDTAASGGALRQRSTLLVIREPRAESHNPVAIAARVFGLTPAQVQVLAFLAQGHTPEAISDIIGISSTTVRSHLSELFRRTGTGRQADLLARTLYLASPLRGAAAVEGTTS
jgi:DNA-binding CsgD family transcriptional regulator/PAS domain-containing protein